MIDSPLLRQSLSEELAFALRQSRPRRIRTPLEFAEQEIIIPEGDWRGFRFASRRQPYSRHLLQAFESTEHNRFASIGCVQSGKTLHTFVIPLAWHLAELQETVIAAAPSDDINESKLKTEIRPVFEASPRLAPLWPKGKRKGATGFAREIRLNNGTVLRFMSAGGGDATRSAFTSRVVFVTEVDKMDEAGEASEEADPITQLESRTEHYGPNKRVYLECTLSDFDGRIWQEYNGGTASRLVCPCPHCGQWVRPEREHLRGFEDAADEYQVEAASYFACPSCGHAITDDERFRMVTDAKLCHRGQEIAPDGEVTGEAPRTRTLGFRWSAFDNVLSWPTSHIAVGEWRCHRSKIADDVHLESLEKKQCQFVWTLPYEDPTFDDFKLTRDIILKRTGTLDRGQVPANATHLSIGVDIGKWTCWWVLLAGMQDDCSMYVPAYGAFNPQHDNPDDEAAVELSMLASLREFADEIVSRGFVIEGGSDRIEPSQVWVDAGYKNNVVEAFLRETGTMRHNRYLACYGRGRSQVNQRSPYHRPKKKSRTVRQIGEGWYLQRNFDAKVSEIVWDSDAWKLRVQEAFATESGQGSIKLFRPLAGPKEHNSFAKHIDNEKYIKRAKPNRGVPGEWEIKGQNHYLDALAMAAAALNRAGFRLVPEADKVSGSGTWFAGTK